MVAMVLRTAAIDRGLLRQALMASAAIGGFDAASATVLALSGSRSRRGAVTSAVTPAASASLGAVAACQVQ